MTEVTSHTTNMDARSMTRHAKSCDVEIFSMKKLHLAFFPVTAGGRLDSLECYFTTIREQLFRSFAT